jgi:hypothetical protein
MNTDIGTVGLVVLVVGYFLPTIVANVRNHPNATPILLTNVIFGWTALIWAFTGERQPKLPLSERLFGPPRIVDPLDAMLHANKGGSWVGRPRVADHDAYWPVIIAVLIFLIVLWGVLASLP